MADIKARPPVPAEEDEQPDSQSGGRVSSVTEMVASWMRQQSPPSLEMDIASKVTPEHIGQSLEVVDAHDQRVADDAKDRRRDSRVKLGMILVAVIVVIAMLIFSGNGPLLEELVKWITILGAGAFGGHGLAKRSG